MKSQSGKNVSRRSFVRSAAAVGLGAAVVRPILARPASDTIRVGLIGCGGRGTGAAEDCISSSPGVELVAMGDLFPDRMAGSQAQLKGRLGDKYKVTDATTFVGFDAYKQVIACDVNLIVHATPPGFRPMHLMAAIEAGKNVFIEKPSAVDPQGVKTVIAAAALAQKKGLAIVAGTQRRHQAEYVEAMKRIHDGAIGDVVAANVYWNGGDMKGYWKWYDRGDMPMMMWQCRNWPWFTWTSGDHYVEQHVHNLDIAHWALGALPKKVLGMGGRQVRRDGHIWDHFSCEYEYENGVRVSSMARQITGCSDRVAEHIVGTKGTCDLWGSGASISGANAWKFDGNSPNPYVQEHADLIASIRKGEPLNEGKRVAESTMMAIAGRMSAYTGREFNWSFVMNKSTLDLTPPKFDLNADIPMPLVAQPGTTPLT